MRGNLPLSVHLKSGAKLPGLSSRLAGRSCRRPIGPRPEFRNGSAMLNGRFSDGPMPKIWRHGSEAPQQPHIYPPATVSKSGGPPLASIRMPVRG
jgi:hypothetical protein